MWVSKNNMLLYNLGGQGFKSEYKPTQVKFVEDINEGYDRGGKTAWFE